MKITFRDDREVDALRKEVGLLRRELEYACAQHRHLQEQISRLDNRLPLENVCPRCKTYIERNK